MSRHRFVFYTVGAAALALVIFVIWATRSPSAAAPSVTPSTAPALLSLAVSRPSPSTEEPVVSSIDQVSEEQKRAYTAPLESLPAFARELASRLGHDLEVVEVLAAVISRWAAVAPVDACQFLISLPVTPDRQTMLHIGIRRWAGIDPVAATQWFEQQELPPEDRIHLANGVFSGLVSTEPDLALRWYSGLPSSERDRLEVMTPALIPRLLVADSESAASSITEMPVSPLKTELAGAFGAHLAATDVVRALSWAESLGSGEARDAALTAILPVWATADRAAATAYLSAITDPDLRTTIEAQLRNPPPPPEQEP